MGEGRREADFSAPEIDFARFSKLAFVALGSPQKFRKFRPVDSFQVPARY
jgi:hypothetical protein